MSYTAIFRDGPLGGQTRQVDRADHLFHIQAMPPLNTIYAAQSPDVLELPEPDAYELIRARGPYLEYRWVNPSAALRRTNQRLRDELAQAKARIANAQDALEGRS